MRYFWDSQRSLDFGPIAGWASPLQYNFAIEDRDQPERVNNGNVRHKAFGIVIIRCNPDLLGFPLSQFYISIDLCNFGNRNHLIFIISCDAESG